MTRSVPVVLGLAFVAFPATSLAAVQHVNPACGHATVADALTAASDGDTIRVAAGTWPINLGTLSMSLTFEPGAANCGAYAPAVPVALDGGGNQVLNLTGAHTVTFRDLNVGNGGTVTNGGVLAAVSGARIVLSGATVGQATVTGDGGCVHLSGSTLEMEGDAEIRECTAQDDGGGVFATATSTVILRDQAKIVDNDAWGDGGGVHLDGSDLQMSDTTGVSLNVGANGGGIYATGAFDALLEGSAGVTMNIAADGGGIGIVATGATPGLLTLEDAAGVNANEADRGGGIFVDCSSLGGSAQVVAAGSVKIDGNGARLGGGLYTSQDVTATGITVSGNVASEAGGGVYVTKGAHTFTNARFSANIVTDGPGGGMYLEEQADVLVKDDPTLCSAAALAADRYCSEFTHNEATNGGGVAVLGVYASNRTAYIGNIADGRGGAVGVGGTGDASIGNARVTGNDAGATGGALDSAGQMAVHHATVADNLSHGVAYTSTGTGSIDNSILWADSGDELNVAAGAAVTVDYTDTQVIVGAPAMGAGNLSSAPIFVATARGSYHLGALSPVLGGCPPWVAAFDARDQDQSARPLAGNVDMGAFERP